MTSESFLLRATEAERLARDLLDFAGSVRAEFTADDTAEASRSGDRLGLSEIVSRMLQARRHRREHLDASLFGEPAWEMLLVLFHANLSGTVMPVAEVCDSVGPYTATSHRWIGILTEFGLVEAAHQNDDSGSRAVRLTEKGIAQMTRIIADTHDLLSVR